MSLVGVFALPAFVFLARVEILRAGDSPAPGWLNAVTGLCLLQSLHQLMKVLRGGFVLAPGAVILQGAWRSRRLPQAAIEGCRIRRVTAKGAHAVELRSPSAGDMTLWFDDDEIRAAPVVAWLAALPGGAGGAVGAPSPPRKPLDASTIAAILVPPLVVAASALGSFANGLRPALQPLPAIEQLHRTEGVLERAGGCRQSRASPPFVAEIATASGPVRPNLQCRYAGVWLQFRVGHRIAILSDDAGEVWAVAIDGQPLVTHAQERARRIDLRGSALAAQLLLALAALTVACTCIQAWRARARRDAAA